MPKTILVVEDDPIVRSIYNDVLSDRGYRVVLATQGAEGVHLARRCRPDLILMDIRMPVMSGWDAMKYLRSDASTARTPVWALSAFMSADEPREGSESMFDRLIEKPVGAEAILSLVEEYLGPP